MRRLSLFSLLVLPALAGSAVAQPADTATAVAGTVFGEASGGYTSFLDGGSIDHGGGGAALRVYIAPWLSVGPEMVYMIGPGSDRDTLLLLNVTVDLRRSMVGQVGRVEPYLTTGAGLLRHEDSRGPYSWANTGPVFTWGGGARVWVARWAYVGSDMRLGWPAHVRVMGTMGVRF